MKIDQILRGLTSFIPILLIFANYGWAAPKFRVLHAFGDGQDGAGTWGSLILDREGRVYGTTSGGGLFTYGTVFALTPKSNGKWGETILHNFKNDARDGCVSTAGLTFDASGNLYGTTSNGGFYEVGTVFELIPEKGGGWREKILHNFNDATAASVPYAGLIFDASGNLYGTTVVGDGTVYEIAP